MNIFLTGASGFVGGAIAQKLAPEHRILAMSRSERSDAKIRALGCEPVRCELGKVGPEHMAGCEVVIHCAAHVEEWGPEEIFHKINVEGTAQLLTAAKAAGVKRFIHMGTEAALFQGEPLVRIDESAPYAIFSPFPYSRTKAKAEKRVLGANVDGVFETISLRPRLIWGPGDQTILPVMLKMIKSGAFRWIDEGRAMTSSVYIDNLVHAVELALTRGQGGQAYFITDDADLPFRDFVSQVVATQGVSMPNASMPAWAAKAMAAALAGTWKLLGRKDAPPLTPFAAAMLSVECTINIAKAKAELGYAPIVSFEQGLEAMRKSA